MQIAYTVASGKGDTDMMLLGLSQALAKHGFRLAGTVQINTDRECEGPCDMEVKVLPDGPIVRISQSLGKHAKGCRLDPEALETAVGHVSQSMASQPDLLVVNKFGKHEALGRGFRDVIAEALSQDIPVIVGLNRLNQDDFMTFVGGEATRVEPTLAALQDWAEGACGTRNRAA
ncbi:DUF2478 domain-containing protein [Pacificoceanicola onchidii]|uniref:DUF2478 domain-containing protein n=1 Tax=Pacificoceanicola onchidii TaxID=2562685 RepID=UPI0010A39F50|nr:DUF2478 domain-containing protein [Pacificoceanicola onchidii]